jgi:hypothetical protein
MITFEQPNAISLTHYHGWDDSCASGPLCDQLATAKIPFEQMDVPHLVSMAGNASLVFYVSPKTGKPVTVLLIPSRADIDSFGEEYFYFEGMTREQAMADERFWPDAYEQARGTVRDEIKK